MINQTATNNLKFLIDPTFSNVNRLFVLAFPNEEEDLLQSNIHRLFVLAFPNEEEDLLQSNIHQLWK